jgi:phage protein U
MNKYQKAAKHLNSIGCEAMPHNHGVSIVARREDSKNYWVDISDDEVIAQSQAYDDKFGGYATLKDIVAWADKQRESEIIEMSLGELIIAYKKYTNA